MALAEAQVDLDVRSIEIQQFAIRNTETIFAGAYVMLDDADGRIRNNADLANMTPVGRVTGFDPPDTADGQATGIVADTVRGIVDLSSHILHNIPVTNVAGEADVQELVYMTDENTFTLLATAMLAAIGRVVRFQSAGNADVLIFGFDTRTA